MAIRFKCTKCSHSLQVPDEHAGRKAKCPNCGQILPIPAPAQAQPPAKPPIKPAVPAVPSPLGPSTAGPIPSLTKKQKPGKAKPKRPSKQTQPPKDQGRPPELRSGKKAVIFGLILVAVLVLVVVVWQTDWFSSKKEPSRPQPHTTPTTPATTRAPIEKKPAITAEILREQTDQLELQLATLEKLLAVETTVPGLDQGLVGAFKALDEFSRQIQGQPLARTNLSLLLSQNRKWLYEKVLDRAQTLVGQYRFTSAKTLLEQILPAGAVAAKPDTGPPTPARFPRRVARSLGGAGWQGAQQACRDFANGELIKRGLQGEICLWLREESDEFGQTSIILSLDAPSEPLSSFRRQNQSPQKFQQKWAPASEHLSFIRQLQSGAEAEWDIPTAGLMYATIRELERRCMTFETPAKADSELMKRLARRKADYKVHQQILALIARCRYAQALQLAQRLLKDDPVNPDNYRWLLRCYLESYNTKPLIIDATLLLRYTRKIAELCKYDVPNNLLALNLAPSALPQGPGASVHREFIHNRTSLLKRLNEYAGRYKPVIDWMQGESVDLVLRDFEYNPFLAGEPVDLLDAQGLLYTLYSRGAPPGRAALILVRLRPDQQEQGLSLHMPNGQRYRLWNIYPPADSSDLDAGLSASLPEPLIRPLLDLSRINPSELTGQTTIPVVNSLTILRCQLDNGQSRGGWRLRIPRAAVDREQLGPKESRSTRRATPSRGLPYLGPDRPTTRRSSSRTPAAEADKYIWISFPTSAAGGRRATVSRATVNGRNQPITCLVRSGRGKIAYFSDAKGNYVIGLDGKRLYAEKTELLRTLNEEGPDWYLALDTKAYPPELREKLEEYDRSAAQERSPGRPSFGPGAILPGPGIGPVPGRPRTSRPPRRGPFTVAQAASWLSDLAAQPSAPLGRRSFAGRRARTTDSGPVVGRWLNWQGAIIAQLDGRIRQLGRDDFAEPMFYSPQAADDLLNTADTYYQTSLQAWPTLAGEVYRQANKSRLSRLMGLDASASARRSARTQRLTGIDMDKVSLRAEALLASGDSNQAIAIYADLIGFLSLQLQQAITQDLLSTGERPLRGTGGPSDQPQPGLFPGQDLSSLVDRRARQAIGAGPGPARDWRTGRTTTPDSRRFSPQEQFFADADLLLESCAGRAAALEQAGLLAQARQSLRQSSGRIRAYLLTELTEFIERSRARQTPVSPQLKQIRQRWQAISQEKIAAALSRTLQAARGQAITVPSPSSSQEPSAPPVVSTEPSKPPMSLAAWLDSENTDLSPLEPERLMVAAQFSWIRDSIDLDQTEPLAPAQRAQRIIELAQAYQSGAPAEAATAEALWQLGSFMAAMGYQAEAWDCLGQAGALYSQLALALLPEAIEPRGRSELSQQQHYYAYRAAALAALAEAAAIPADEPVSAKCSAMFAAEIRAKLLQLQRGWSGLALAEEPPAILTTAGHALRIVQDLAEAKAYAQPRMRFWWWYYPPELSQRQLSAPGRGPARPPTSSPRSRDSSRRLKLEYIETQQQTTPGRRSQPRRPAPTGPIDHILPPTPGGRLGL